jgi:hypothetical protein
MPTSNRQLNEAVFQSMATQLMANDAVALDGELTNIRQSSRDKVRILSFQIGGRNFEAVEQNPEKPSSGFHEI